MYSPFWINAQSNDSLKVYSDLIQVKNDSTCWNCDAAVKSRDYKIKLYDDTLSIEIKAIDSLRWAKNKEDIHTSTVINKMNIKDIQSIDYISIPKKIFDLEFIDSYIEFTSVRSNPLFKQHYGSKIIEKSSINLILTNQKDSTHFKNLYKYLKENINIISNQITPNCIKDKIHEWSGKEIDATDNSNLEVPIYLNGKTCTNTNIKKIITNYLIDQNIKGVLGYLVINELNLIEILWTEQYNLNQLFNSHSELPIGFKTMIDNIGTITDNQNEELYKILNSQNWKAGQCDNENVRSYIELEIKNEKYKEPGDNNR